MDNLRLLIFQEIASSVRSRNQYIHQIKLTYGEESVPEALRVYDSDRSGNIPFEKRKVTEGKLRTTLTLNFSRIAPSLGKYQISVQQLILIIDAVLILLLFLFPPFFVTLSNGATTSLGYHLIFDPPTYQHVTFQPSSYALLTARIDVAILIAEWISVAAISFLVWKFLVTAQDRLFLL